MVTKAWCQLLIHLIPESELENVARSAFEDHIGNFPVTAYEMKDAWFRSHPKENYEQRILRLAEEERAAQLQSGGNGNSETEQKLGEPILH